MREQNGEYVPMIRDMPAEERPRERLRERGPEALNNAELLAILLRTGGNGENVLNLAQRVMSRVEGVGALGRVTLTDLCAVKGIGKAKAAQILAGIELGRRIVKAMPESRPVISCSSDVDRLVRADLVDQEQEHLQVVLLNTRNQVLGVKTVYIGSVHTAVVRTSELLREAVRENCPSIILVHNHPSGDPSPSPDDAAMTQHAVEAGKMLNIEVLDHVVVARGGYVSLKERGLGFGVVRANAAKSLQGSTRSGEERALPR
ncbi:MAG TPA: DNA repair protein RadC [Dehalococcoidia bacterium]|nr:DNA repair protein RadC [Dehalococcoidia bacterium]